MDIYVEFYVFDYLRKKTQVKETEQIELWGEKRREGIFIWNIRKEKVDELCFLGYYNKLEYKPIEKKWYISFWHENRFYKKALKVFVSKDNQDKCFYGENLLTEEMLLQERPESKKENKRNRIRILPFFEMAGLLFLIAVTINMITCLNSFSDIQDVLKTVAFLAGKI